MPVKIKFNKETIDNYLEELADEKYKESDKIYLSTNNNDIVNIINSSDNSNS